MTTQELIAWAHKETGTEGTPSPAVVLLAYYASILEGGYSAAYRRDALRVALIEKAELPKLNLDNGEPVT